jgi:RHS repeat-associated protein
VGTSPGLYYIGARWMDPELGRFVSMDPFLGRLGLPQSMNRYVYCVDNPLRFVDPTGLWFGISLKTTLKVAIIVGAVALSVGLTVATCGAGAPLALTAVQLMLAQGAICGAASFGTTYLDTGDLKTSLVAGAVGFGIGAGTAGLFSYLGPEMSALPDLAAAGEFASTLSAEQAELYWAKYWSWYSLVELERNIVRTAGGIYAGSAEVAGERIAEGTAGLAMPPELCPSFYYVGGSAVGVRHHASYFVGGKAAGAMAIGTSTAYSGTVSSTAGTQSYFGYGGGGISRYC